MDRRSLEFFRAVAEEGSVSGAAQRMFVTQPAVSKQVSRLESGLGLKLFHRTSAGMAMTSAGEALYDLGGDVLTRFERIEGALKLMFAERPALRLASPHTTASVLITPFMAATNAPISDLLIVNAPEVDGLLDRDVDMAVSTLRPPPHRHQMVVAPLTIFVQGTPAAMAARFGDSPVADLEKLGGDTLFAPRTGVHVIIEEAGAGLGRSLSVRGVATGLVAQALAANDHGLALVTEQVSFELKGLPAYAGGRPVVVALYASWDAQHYAAAGLRELAGDFRHWLSVTPPWGPFPDVT